MIKVCDICGKRAECVHHLIFGFGYRNLADEDALLMNMCNECHNLASGTGKIHGNSMAENLSKKLGQAIWERDHIAKAGSQEAVRQLFMLRYGRSFL